MNVQLTITIVAYHNYEQIKTAITSIEKYTSPDITKRIYVSDNSVFEDGAVSSEKNSFLAFLSKYEDVEYIENKENLGFGKGHNIVVDKVVSDYHAIVNPDIEINEDVFSAILSYMDGDKNIGMVIPKIVDENGNLQAAYREYPTLFDMFVRMFCKPFFKKRQAAHTLQHMDYSKPFAVPFAQGCFLVVRTSLFKSEGGFDDRYFMYMEDADLCRRINQHSQVMYYPGAAVVHAWEKGSHRNLKLLKIHILSMIRYFNKWGWTYI